MSSTLKAVFSKTGSMVFISHLDLVRLFQRACRRAEIPVTMTQGFNPHLKISITKALKLGVPSEGEEASFFLDAPLSPDIFRERLNRQLPTGIEIKKAEEVIHERDTARDIR